MHLPRLTLMEQFNVISEGSRAAGKACAMRGGQQLPWQAACRGRVGETAQGRPPRTWGRAGEGLAEGEGILRIPAGTGSVLLQPTDSTAC